jgi:hypothetical protein
MKKIKPIQIWVNGIIQTATTLNAYGVGLQFGVSATIYYSITNEEGMQCASGNLNLDGEDYQKWGDDDNYAWNFVAQKLNLEIIGDYEPQSPDPEN